MALTLTSFTMSLGLQAQVLALGLSLEGQVLGLGLGLCVLDSNTAELKHMKLI